MIKEESYEQAGSNSVKWDFKNNPPQPVAMYTKAGVRFPKNELEWF